MHAGRPEERLQASLADVTRLLEKHRVVEALVHKTEGARQALVEQLQHRQNLAELNKKVRTLHPADAAFILEALPPDQRLIVWSEIDTGRKGHVLVEVGDAVRPSLIDALDRAELSAALRTLDADDLAFLSDSVPAEALQDASHELDAGERSWLETSIAYPEDTVGHVMTPDAVAMRDTLTVGQVLDELRQRHELPSHTDCLFVVDSRHVLRGVVPIEQLLLNIDAAPIVALMDETLLAFEADEQAEQAAKAFERYDLLSAPVVDDRGKLLGRLTVDVVLDIVRPGGGTAGADAGRTPTGRRSVRADVGFGAQPLAVADAEPAHGRDRVARDRRVRGRDCSA